MRDGGGAENARGRGRVEDGGARRGRVGRGRGGGGSEGGGVGRVGRGRGGGGAEGEGCGSRGAENAAAGWESWKRRGAGWGKARRGRGRALAGGGGRAPAWESGGARRGRTGSERAAERGPEGAGPARAGCGRPSRRARSLQAGRHLGGAAPSPGRGASCPSPPFSPAWGTRAPSPRQPDWWARRAVCGLCLLSRSSAGPAARLLLLFQPLLPRVRGCSAGAFVGSGVPGTAQSDGRGRAEAGGRLPLAPPRAPRSIFVFRSS